MRQSLNSMFLLLGNNEEFNFSDGDLFGFSEQTYTALPPKYDQSDIDFLYSYFKRGFDISGMNTPARTFFELSQEAFDIFVYAWMSELPVKAQMLSFGRRVFAALKLETGFEEKLIAAGKAVCDRSNDDTRTVLAAFSKVQNEIHRMMGLLRFFPDNKGVYTAHFEPDHFILAALGEYFKSRFGETAWAVIDEKRGFCLHSLQENDYRLSSKDNYAEAVSRSKDEWEELWKHYHKTINNENRENKGLQRQFMPKRYWKYLPEVK